MAPEQRQIRVIVCTDRHRIEGELTLYKGEHVPDKMNTEGRQYESLVDVKIFSADGNLLYETPWLALNKRHIVWMAPL
ncbi:hypothetical protein HQ520_00845 [bacterium]|nr:hypothetical protein [bacterium]